jgi:hypothetical protein
MTGSSFSQLGAPRTANEFRTRDKANPKAKFFISVKRSGGSVSINSIVIRKPIRQVGTLRLEGPVYLPQTYANSAVVFSDMPTSQAHEKRRAVWFRRAPKAEVLTFSKFSLIESPAHRNDDKPCVKGGKGIDAGFTTISSLASSVNALLINSGRFSSFARNVDRYRARADCTVVLDVLPLTFHAPPPLQ